MSILWLNSRLDPTVASAPSQPTPTDASEPGEADWRRYRFRLLYDAHHDDLWRYCLLRAATTEEAEEALSETFAVAWQRLDAVPAGDGARPWLFGVARNHLRSGWRKFRRSSELHDRLVATHREHHVADPAIAAADESEAILAALTRLREKDQEILRLAAWDELPHAEIAQLLGCSENTVAVRLHRARDRLRKALSSTERVGPTNQSRTKLQDPPSRRHVGGTDPDDSTKEVQR